MVLYTLIIFFTASPFFPALGNPHWFFRTADFVRIQSLFIQFTLLVLLILRDEFDLYSWIMATALVGSMAYQLIKVIPYSSLYPQKKDKTESNGLVSILAGNVLQTNTRYPDFLEEIKRFDPDLVLTMESNKEWENSLSKIGRDYPFSVKVPLENFYGMHLYSKVALDNVEVKYQIEADKPSIFFDYPMKGKNSIFFCCLHPAPPSPTENETSKEADAELILTGKQIRKKNRPSVVCGDMNDVVWSRTTRLFKKMTGMVDPRVGRGFFSTYNANYFFLRFPLDHLFHTKDLFVGKMVRSRYFGSDHYAMYYEIHHKRNAPLPESPKIDGEEKEEVEEIVEEGKRN